MLKQGQTGVGLIVKIFVYTNFRDDAMICGCGPTDKNCYHVFFLQ